MKAIKILLQLEEPLLATQPNAGEANSATSYNFIPGGMLRGAFVRAYLQKYPGKDIANEARDLFFDGTVQFLNAYLAAPDGTRMLPTPLSWFVDKDDTAKKDAEMFDFAVKVNHKLQKPKHPKGGFCSQKSNGVILNEPTRNVSVHNASNERGRKRAGESQVFRYDAIAQNQVFAGAVIADDIKLLTTLKNCVDGIFFLGGSHTGGYGPVKVTCTLDETEWQEYAPATKASNTITLLSDVLLPTKEKPILDTLADALGIKADEIVNSYYQTRLVGGFNRTWGLPLPQGWAIQAGSVFCLSSNAKVDAASLSSKGVGERRTEGFGRVAVNWQDNEKIQRLPVDVLSTNIPVNLSAESTKVANKMATRLLKIHLEIKLTELLARDWKFSQLPSATQLNRVRVAARHSMLTGDTSYIKNHLSTIKSAKKTWEQAKVNGQPLEKWVEEYSVMDANKFRNVFGMEQMLPQIAGQSGSLTPKLISEYNARLVDGVMKHAVEDKRLQEGR